MAKLLCVVMDGLRPDALECAHVRFLDKLIQTGTICRQVRGVRPGLTLPALCSMLTSLPPEKHGVITDSDHGATSCHAVSLFSLLWYGHRSSSLFYSREPLRTLAPCGALHTGMLVSSQGIRNVDRQLADAVASHLQREATDFCLLYLQGIDIAGTHFGYMSEPYLESVEQADHALELLFENLIMVGLQHEYVLMVVSGHPGSWVSERQDVQGSPRLPLIIAGPGIAAGVELDREVSALDITPTLAKILEIPPHPVWQGRVVEEIFVQEQADSQAISLQKFRLVERNETRPAA